MTENTANPDAGNCTTCKQIITFEHGGIHCSCGRIYCCDENCIPEHFLTNDISQRQDIPLCPACEEELMEEIEQEKEDKRVAALYYGGWW